MVTLKRFDIHMHLAGTGCNCSGCFVDPSLLSRYTFFFLRLMQGISKKDLKNNFDQNWIARISALLKSSTIDYGVILGFDGAYEQKSGKLDDKKTQLIIPPSWVFTACKQFPNLLPGPSINPHREDALDVLDYCIEEKAVLIKWLPSAQLIDASQTKIKKFYEKLAKAQIPLLIHCCGERTFRSYNAKLNNVAYLRYPLEAGVKVICAHSGTEVIGSGAKDQLPELVQLLYSYNQLWVDNSGLCNPSRFSWLPKLTEIEILVQRTLYGSDWPIPTNSFYYIGKMPLKKIRELEKMTNTIERDIEIKRYFNYPEETLTRAAGVLANLDFWVPS